MNVSADANSFINKRQFPRCTLATKVSVFSQNSFSFGLSYDIGEGGMRLMGGHGLNIGERVEVHFFIPKKGFVNVVGEVVYILAQPEEKIETPEQAAKSVGIKFVEIDSMNQFMIREYVTDQLIT